MSKVHQKVETVANVLVILVTIAIGGILVQRYFFPATANQPTRLEPTIGAKMSAPDVDWSQQSKTLIFVLQSSCHFCNESAPFYKRLIEETKGKNIKLVAAFPTPVEESAAHLTKLGLTGMEIKQTPISDLNASGTPTLILTNDKGEVTNFWVGKLPPEKETEVFNQINS